MAGEVRIGATNIAVTVVLRQHASRWSQHRRMSVSPMGKTPRILLVSPSSPLQTC